MTQVGAPHAPLRVDALILVVSLMAGAWVATHPEKDLESALGLLAPQRNAPIRGTNSLKVISGIHVDTLRERYANQYPHAPLTTINRIPVVITGWNACARVRDAGLPFLTIAGLGVGFVAIRRPRPETPCARVRWRPGRVAAAISVVLSVAGLTQEFLLRHFDLRQYGFDHDPLATVWENNALCVGTAIAAAWVLLSLAGRWKPEPGWREKVGLGLGATLLANLLWATVLEPLAQF